MPTSLTSFPVVVFPYQMENEGMGNFVLEESTHITFAMVHDNVQTRNELLITLQHKHLLNSLGLVCWIFKQRVVRNFSLLDHVIELVRPTITGCSIQLFEAMSTTHLFNRSSSSIDAESSKSFTQS